MKQEVSSCSTSELLIITPVFNDWPSVRELLVQLDSALRPVQRNVHVLIINDGSSQQHEEVLECREYSAIRKIEVLDLTCNLGHQRAIAVGLVHAAANTKAQTIVIMDSDGEDAPTDVPLLVRHLHQHPESEAVFAGRYRRSESPLFRFGYWAYRMMHLLLTGIRIRFGNFSALRTSAARQLVYQDALWNHYAAAVVRSRIPYTTLPTTRGTRFEGKSKQNILHLMIHGFSALSVFSGAVCCRLFMAMGILFMAAGIAAAKMLSGNDISMVTMLTVSSLGAALLASFLLHIIALVALRSIPSFVPARDAGVFIRTIRNISLARRNTCNT